jgi:hypothetical protein
MPVLSTSLVPSGLKTRLSSPTSLSVMNLPFSGLVAVIRMFGRSLMKSTLPSGLKCVVTRILPVSRISTGKSQSSPAGMVKASRGSRAPGWVAHQPPSSLR